MNTVFSIDPKTNLPYMTPEHAEKLAFTHIFRKGRNLLKQFDVEDLKQTLLMTLHMKEYKPALSSAKTFAIMVFNHKCGHIHRNNFVAADRWRVMGDFMMATADANVDGGDAVNLATDVLGIEYTTPEDVCLAQEVIENVVCVKCEKAMHITEFRMNIKTSTPLKRCKVCHVSDDKNKSAKKRAKAKAAKAKTKALRLHSK